MAAITDPFEYVDVPALDAEWPVAISSLSVAAWDIETSVIHQGSYAAKLTVVGAAVDGDEAVRRKTFTSDDGIQESLPYHLSIWVWLNEEFGDNIGHNLRFGIRVPGQGEAFVPTPPGNTINDWTLLTLVATSSASSELTVEIGAFDASTNPAHDRLARFDELIVTDDPWADILLNAGVLTVNNQVVGYTTGGLKFDLERVFTQRQVEGVITPVLGMEYVSKVRARFVGSMITANIATRNMIEPGAIVSTVDDTTTYTPIYTLTTLSTGQYLTNVAVTWPRLGGGHLRVRFPKALCTKYDINGKDKQEAQIPVEIEARLDVPGGAGLTESPYYIDVINDA